MPFYNNNTPARQLQTKRPNQGCPNFLKERAAGTRNRLFDAIFGGNLSEDKKVFIVY